MAPTRMDIPSTITLNNGVAIPRLGLGVFRAGAGHATEAAVQWALESGYRHIDTAAVYGNEREVGVALQRAIDAGMVTRQDVFVTTKLWNDDHGFDAALRAFDRSLEKLRLGYIDLFLIHWPVEGHRLKSWRALERISSEGRCRAIGVSNFMVHHLRELLELASMIPAVNQIELHPFLQQRDVVGFCRANGIAVEAYSPLTKGRMLEDARLRGIAARVGKTPAQILVRWSIQRGFIVIPKSGNRGHIIENAAVSDFELGGAEMEALDDLDAGIHTAWDPSHVP